MKSERLSGIVKTLEVLATTSSFFIGAIPSPGRNLPMSSNVSVQPSQHDFAGRPGAEEEYATITNLVQNHRTEVDYKTIWSDDVPVLFIGDYPSSVLEKKEIASAIPDFKQRGMTHLAIGYFAVKDQGVLDDYSRGAKGREDLRGLLERGFGLDNAFDNLLDLVEVARQQEVKLVALQTWRHYKDERDFVGDLKVMELTSNPVPGISHDWADIIENIKKTSPDARILVYGSARYMEHSTPSTYPTHLTNEFLNERGIKTKVVGFAGGDKGFIPYYEDVFPSTREMMYSDSFTSSAARKLGIEDTKFGIPLDAKFYSPADYLIHLPKLNK